MQEQANKITELEKIYIELEKELDDKDSERTKVEMTLRSTIEKDKRNTEPLKRSGEQPQKSNEEKDRKSIFLDYMYVLTNFFTRPYTN